MSKIIIKKTIDLFVLLVSVAVFVWFWQYQPQPQQLVLTLSSNVTGEQRIDTFFYEKNKPPAGVAHRISFDLKEPSEYYFIYPRHFQAYGTVLHLGAVPGEWEIRSIEARSHLFMFSLEMYRWPFTEVPSLVATDQTSTIIEVGDTILVKDSERRPRLFLNLDLETAIEKS